MLYCLGNVIGGLGDGQSVIEVFYLGELADKCKLLTKIYLWKLFEKLHEIEQPDYEIWDKYKQAKEYQIRSIEPITYS